MKDEIDSTNTEISTAREEIAGTQADIGRLENELEEGVSGLS
ncbi:hypothetical protein ACFLTV_01785 [Chloroflexota bacterium]